MSFLNQAAAPAGGGAVTFGAPQVIYSEDPGALYAALTSLESRGWFTRQATRPAAAELHFHNFVNNADIVPRLLGQSLEAVHDRLQHYIPSMQVSGCCSWNHEQALCNLAGALQHSDSVWCSKAASGLRLHVCQSN